MSRGSIENTEDNSQVELRSKEHDISNLSDYAKNLEKNVKSRYLEKISLVRIDPATLFGAFKFGSRMSSADRGHRSPLLLGNGYQLLYKGAIQSLQKYGSLQPNGFGFYHKC